VARRRRSKNFFAELGDATLRLAHRVPLIGLVLAIGCGAGWWWFRQRPDLWGSAVGSIALAVLGGLFALVAIIGLLRNLFPENDGTRRRRS